MESLRIKKLFKIMVLSISICIFIAGVNHIAAYAASGTVSFVVTESTSGGENIGTVLHYGEDGSSDISGIQLDIFNANSASDATNGISTGSFLFMSRPSSSDIVPTIFPLDVTTGTVLSTGGKPPKFLVIKSNDGSEFDFKSLFNQV